MTAIEAKELAKKSRSVEMSSIYGTIKAAAMKGDESVSYNLEGNFAKFADDIMDKLRAQGYQVKRSNGSDQRDNSSWDYLQINW